MLDFMLSINSIVIGFGVSMFAIASGYYEFNVIAIALIAGGFYKLASLEVSEIARNGI